ncbi:hypothetical protein XEULMG905_21420, partial [Xanthomonas euvesicatoria]
RYSNVRTHDSRSGRRARLVGGIGMQRSAVPMFRAGTGRVAARCSPLWICAPAHPRPRAAQAQ